MTAIRRSFQAADDLEAVRSYIARDSATYGRLVVQRIVAAVEALATSPQPGRVVPEPRDPEIRELIVGAYRVVYRCRPGIVEISTNFQGARLFRGNDIQMAGHDSRTTATHAGQRRETAGISRARRWGAVGESGRSFLLFEDTGR